MKIDSEVAFNHDGVVVTGWVKGWNPEKSLELSAWLEVFDEREPSENSFGYISRGKLGKDHTFANLTISPVNGNEVSNVRAEDYNTGFSFTACTDLGAGKKVWGQFQLEFKGDPNFSIWWTIEDWNGEILSHPMPSFALGNASSEKVISFPK